MDSMYNAKDEMNLPNDSVIYLSQNKITKR